MKVFVVGAGVVGGVAVAVSGCGEVSQGAPERTVRPAAVVSPVAEDAAVIVAEARAALLGQASFHAKGSVSEDGWTSRIDVRLKGDDVAGSVTVPLGDKNVAVDLVRVGGTTWFRSPEVVASTFGSAQVKRVGKRWVAVAETDEAAFAEFTARDALAGMPLPEDAVIAGERTTVNGKAALPVSDGSDRLLYLSAEPGHLPVSLGDRAHPAQVVFTYGEKSEISRPKDVFRSE